ncbi:MAG TPA: hypothetical protein VF082_07200, partial [Jiangellaceae bacterium]
TAFLTAREAFCGELALVRFAGAFLGPDLRVAVARVRDAALDDLVGDCLEGAMGCRYPTVTERNPVTASARSQLRVFVFGGSSPTVRSGDAREV